MSEEMPLRELTEESKHRISTDVEVMVECSSTFTRLPALVLLDPGSGCRLSMKLRGVLTASLIVSG